MLVFLRSLLSELEEGAWSGLTYGPGPSSPIVRGPFEARISLSTTTRFQRHLPRAHPLAMSLNVANCNFAAVEIGPMLVSVVRGSRAPIRHTGFRRAS